MNREELERKIKEEFSSIEHLEMVGADGINQFIFEEILSEVIMSFIPNNRDWQYSKFLSIRNNSIHGEEYEILFRQKAKELYNITL